jgi:uncharacterized membrane protein YdjX (TVP38/TMEM64 family)
VACRFRGQAEQIAGAGQLNVSQPPVTNVDGGNRRGGNAIRCVALVVIMTAALVIARWLPIGQAIDLFRAWISGLGVWGPMALAISYVLATVLMVPGTILTLVAGATFGFIPATVAVSLGSTLGAACAFLIARYVARDKVAELASRNARFGTLDRAIEQGGWKIVALLRLSPAIPFNVQNYLYGLTKIRFWPYVVTSWVAMLPGTFLYVYLGHVTGAVLSATRSRTNAEWILLAVGLLATVAVTVYITRLARRQRWLAYDDSPPRVDGQAD